jgi:hypothetical protein
MILVRTGCSSFKSKFLRFLSKMKITEAIEIIRKACESRVPEIETLVTNEQALRMCTKLKMELERLTDPKRRPNELHLLKYVTTIKVQNEPVVGVKLGQAMR